MDLAVRVRPTLVENVSSVSLSEFVANSAQLVNRAPGILRAARDLADVVIVEAPPVLAYHDTEALSQAVDVVLVVGDCAETKLERAKQAGELLRRMNAPVLGVVLTSVEIGTRDIRHARICSAGIRRSRGSSGEGARAGASRRRLSAATPKLSSRREPSNGDGTEVDTVPDSEPETLEHVRNGNGERERERRTDERERERQRKGGRRQTPRDQRPLEPRERNGNGNGHGNGNGKEKVAVADPRVQDPRVT